ncbi:MAG: hypothetical protein P8X63_13950, partial [Desulfuromonadaceae bacterium]
MLSQPSAALSQLEFVQVFLTLEFTEPYGLRFEQLLRLRRNLRQTAAGELLDRRAFAALFEPEVATDPYARRRHQRPGPPFVIHPPVTFPPMLSASDRVELPVVLFGPGIPLLPDFCRVFQELGARGFHRGEGRFTLVEVAARDLAGNRMPIHFSNEGRPAPLPVSHAGWFLDQFTAASAVELRLQTPARLLSGGRPLFRPRFQTLFPFLLRRVSSMAAAYGAVELIDDPGLFLAASEAVVERENRLAWRDWR